MAVYSYIALDEQGREQRGRVEASDARQATGSLRDRAIYVVDIQEGVGDSPPVDNASGFGNLLGMLSPRQYLPVRDGDMVLFFRQIALMLRAGHTLVEALEASRNLVIKRGLRAAIGRMSESIQRGSSFSAAAAMEKSLFSPMVISLIESGEHSGDLDPVLERLAENLERHQDLKRQLITALTYPSIVVLAAVGVSVFLIVVVIPRFAKFLASKRVDIPPSTQALLDISDWFERWGAIFGTLLFLVLFGMLAAYTTRPGKKVIDRAILVLPIIGKAVMYAAMAQACWIFAMLLRSGVTALQSLRITSGVVGNRVLADGFEQAAEKILQGSSLSNALEHPQIPLLVRHMAAVGERSGQLDTVMSDLGEFYRKELEALIKVLTAMVEPILILMVGGMVGFIYYAFFQAVIKVSTGGM